MDFAFVRALVLNDYVAGQRSSFDPVVFLHLRLVIFFEGVRSDGQLLAVAADRLNLSWYLSYDLAEPPPDDPILMRFREHSGADVFCRCFDLIVERCWATGLLRGEELYENATNGPGECPT